MKLTESGKAKMQYAVQGGRCFWCRATFPLADMTRDHVIPRGWGGNPDWPNIVLSCEPCNTARGQRLADREAVIEKADDDFAVAWASGDGARIRDALIELQTALEPTGAMLSR